MPILEATTSIATEEGIQPEELAEAAGIAAEERPREDSQAIGVGILAVGEGSLSCPEEELRTVVADSELVRTAGVVVNRSRARVAFRKVVEEVSRRVLGVAFHITAVALRRHSVTWGRRLLAEHAHLVTHHRGLRWRVIHSLGLTITHRHCKSSWLRCNNEAHLRW